MIDLPLFPLNTVLFPGTPLQLYIFEERYKQMIADCQQTNTPFGIAMIRNGESYEGQASPCSTGCTAEIAQIQYLTQGRLKLIVVGKDRFHIRGLDSRKTYLMGTIEITPISVPSPIFLEVPDRRLRSYVERYLALASKDNQYQEIINQLPKDPIKMGYLAAMILQVPAEVKQNFLEINNAVELLESLQFAYHREVALLKVLLRETETDPSIPFSRN